MKRQSIIFILLLLLTLFTFTGCSGTEKTALPTADAIPEESAALVEDTAAEEASLTDNSSLEQEIIQKQRAANVPETVENVDGIFEGLEDNHTALFSFDGVEIPFFFEEPEVQTLLSDAIIGSTYTLSYKYDPSLGLNVIYEISE